MANLDRFKTPRPDEEPAMQCDNCRAVRRISALMYDEWARVFLCDRECFDEWHDDNAEIVGDYYFEMNIE